MKLNTTKTVNPSKRALRTQLESSRSGASEMKWKDSRFPATGKSQNNRVNLYSKKLLRKFNEKRGECVETKWIIKRPRIAI